MSTTTDVWLRQYASPPLGRDGVIEQVAHRLLTPSRSIVTVTGEGGVGKTRVAVAAVHQVLATIDVRVVVVDLADERDPSAVMAAIATALDLGPTDDLAASVAEALGGERTMLVLDPFEHLVVAAPVLNDLLAACPTLSVLVVSRTPLRVHDERVVHVDTLTPDGAAALELFRRAARIADGDVDADDTTIAELCRELGGLPLAIELAASRTRLLSPTALLEQLRTKSALAVLTGGGTERPLRQRGLQATLEWTCALLDDHERAVLDAAATSGAWLEFDELIELSERATGLDRSAVIAALDGLDTHRLIDVDRGRGTTLARVRPVVRELVGPATTEAFRAATVAFARRAAEGVHGPQRLTWLRAIDRRRDDLVTALDHALSTQLADDTDDIGALALALVQAWHRHPDPRRDHMLRAAIDHHAPTSPVRLRLEAWRHVFDAMALHDPSRAGEGFTALIDHAVEAADTACVIDVCALSITAAPHSLHFPDAFRHAAIGRAHADLVGDVGAAAVFDLATAMITHLMGDLAGTAALARSALAGARTAGDTATVAYAQMLLVHLPREVVVATGPVPSIDATVDQVRNDDDTHLLIHLLPTLAFELLGAGQMDAAAAAAVEGLQAASRLGRRGESDVFLVVILILAARTGDHRGAATVHGMLHERLPMRRPTFPPAFTEALDGALDAVRLALGEQADGHAVGVGATMRADEALAFALATAARCAGPTTAPTRHGLSPKEVEVVRCLARGRTNKEIAAELAIANKTVMHHLASIFRKLALRNRSEVIGWAFSSGLVSDTAPTVAAGS